MNASTDRDAILSSTWESTAGHLWTVVGSDPVSARVGRASLRVATGGVVFWISSEEFWKLVRNAGLVETERVA